MCHKDVDNETLFKALKLLAQDVIHLARSKKICSTGNFMDIVNEYINLAKDNSQCKYITTWKFNDSTISKKDIDKKM